MISNSSNYLCFVISPLVCLLAILNYMYVTFTAKYLVPLFQWHACELATVSLVLV